MIAIALILGTILAIGIFGTVLDLVVKGADLFGGILDAVLAKIVVGTHSLCSIFCTVFLVIAVARIITFMFALISNAVSLSLVFGAVFLGGIFGAISLDLVFGTDGSELVFYTVFLILVTHAALLVLW